MAEEDNIYSISRDPLTGRLRYVTKEEFDDIQAYRSGTEEFRASYYEKASRKAREKLERERKVSSAREKLERERKVSSARKKLERVKKIYSSQGSYRLLNVRETAQSPYRLLGVKETDSLEDIKKVYRGLAKKYHPDISPSSESEFIAIKKAWEEIRVVREPD